MRLLEIHFQLPYEGEFSLTNYYFTNQEDLNGIINSALEHMMDQQAARQLLWLAENAIQIHAPMSAATKDGKIEVVVLDGSLLWVNGYNFNLSVKLPHLEHELTNMSVFDVENIFDHCTDREKMSSGDIEQLKIQLLNARIAYLQGRCFTYRDGDTVILLEHSDGNVCASDTLPVSKMIH
tara:strand:- start:241371 stop:241910 length:540 start_codon:yes stop_codon:yes gene_type:complete